ncbi:MAG: MogA/MoaB family molybdenum cofactor biosynthesis protein [Candidatus Acidiferrales bacterium]
MRVAILTISDSVHAGTRSDLSGPAVNERCRERGWRVVATHVAPDEAPVIQARMIEIGDSGLVDLIFTSGGTGIGPRDVTPEATLGVCTRLIPGLAEVMREAGRRSNPNAALSRAVAGVRGGILVVNLPGSPRGAVESFEAIAGLLPHAVEVLRGASHD